MIFFLNPQLYKVIPFLCPRISRLPAGKAEINTIWVLTAMDARVTRSAQRDFLCVLTCLLQVGVPYVVKKNNTETCSLYACTKTQSIKRIMKELYEKYILIINSYSLY